MTLMERRRSLMSASVQHGYKLLASGSYEKTDYSSVPTQVVIPADIQGTIGAILIYAETPVPNMAQTFAWKRFNNANLQEMSDNFSETCFLHKYTNSSGSVSSGWVSNSGYPYYNAANKKLIGQQRDASHKVPNNTYKWFVWGY